MREKRIGVFGGTFNPIHNGHVRAAAAVQKRFSLDRVLFVPSCLPPHKKTDTIASPRDRMKMVELALRGRGRLVPSPIEIRAGGTSYSILTLKKMKKLYPRARIFFILGVDAFLEIKTWKDWEDVVARCLFIVMTRPGYRLREAKGILGRTYESKILEIPKSAGIRERWFSAFGVFLVPITPPDISSTEVRRRIRDGRDFKGWLPPSVEKYIKDHGLYLKRSSKIRDAHG